MTAPAPGQTLLVEGKVCTKCGIRKPQPEFSPRKGGDGIASWCKHCMNHLQRTTGWKGKKRKQLHDHKVKLILINGGQCGLCGIHYNGTNGAIFAFHHRDPVEKSMESVRHSDFDLMLAEAEKCDLLCSNCHKMLHSEEF